MICWSAWRQGPLGPERRVNVAVLQSVKEEPRQPQKRKTLVLVRVGAFSVALLVLSAVVCFFALHPYTDR